MRALAAALMLGLVPGSACGRTEMAPTIQDVKARHEAELLQLPGVVSVGIGRDTDGVLVLVVGLDRDRPETQAALPQQLDGHRVKVQVVGQIRAR